MKDEVFNDHSFKQSLMYAKGVVCADCHDPHSGRLEAVGAAVCAQCHQPERFADGVPHGPRERGRTSPDCMSCHMPTRTYMVVDGGMTIAFAFRGPIYGKSQHAERMQRLSQGQNGHVGGGDDRRFAWPHSERASDLGGGVSTARERANRLLENCC